MQVYKLPLNANVHIHEDELRAVLTSDSTLKPSEVLVAAHRIVDSKGWLAELLDSEFSVNAIVKWDDKVFAVLSSTRAGEPGRIYLPLDVATSSDHHGNDGESFPSSEMNATIEVLRDSFDSVDYEQRPFGWAGKVAGGPTGPVDFYRSSEEEEAREWADSRVLYVSLGGDRLMIRKDGKAAWYQMETGKILEAGDFQSALVRYFHAIKAGDEFSSWTDNIPGQE